MRMYCLYCSIRVAPSCSAVLGTGAFDIVETVVALAAVAWEDCCLLAMVIFQNQSQHVKALMVLLSRSVLSTLSKWVGFRVVKPPNANGERYKESLCWCTNEEVEEVEVVKRRLTLVNAKHVNMKVDLSQ